MEKGGSKGMVISLIVGIVVTSMIWICHELLGGTVPLPIFNLMGILRTPGILITFIIALKSEGDVGAKRNNY